MNRIILIGNLTRDPEQQVLNENTLCKFSIAVQRRFSRDANAVDFFNISVWGKTAENVAKYTRKGTKVAVSGTLQTRQYDAQDGTKRTAYDIIADEVEFLSPKQDSAPNDGDVTKETKSSGLQEVSVEDDDIPF